MALRLYRGSLDSDMIDSCLDEIERDKLSRHLVIIPEHYSYEMEHKMVDRFGVIGLNNIEVLTPHRMAVNYLNTDNTRYLNPAGKQMLVVCAIDSCLEDESVSDGVKSIISRRSFAGSIVSLISEFKRHMITPEILRSCAAAQLNEKSGIGHEHLAEKLSAAAEVYERYNGLLSDRRYIDSDDDASRLAEKIMSDIPAGRLIKTEEDKLAPKKAELRELNIRLKEIYDEIGNPDELLEKAAELEAAAGKLAELYERAQEERNALNSVKAETADEKSDLRNKKTAATRALNKAKKDWEVSEGEFCAAKAAAAEAVGHLGGIPEKIKRLRAEMDGIRSKNAERKRIAVHGGTRVWFMCFDEYLPHHMQLVRAASAASKETTVCLNYVKSDDVYGVTDEEMRMRELDRKFGSVFGKSERQALCSRAEAIYSSYDVYSEPPSVVSANNIRHDAVIYSVMEKSYNKLLAEKPETEKFFSRNDAVRRKPEVDFLVKHYGFFERFNGKTRAIEIAECENPHREIEYAAETIHTLVRESEQRYECAVKRSNDSRDYYAEDMSAALHEVKEMLSGALGYDDEKAADELMEWLGIGRPRRPAESDLIRYRDIGILFGGASDYTHILDSIFTGHNIQYFADEKIILSEHPIAVQLLSVFDIFESDWRYESMFRFLNAGFVFEKKAGRNGEYISRLDAGEIARLDNYVVRYDIRGRKLWEREWEFYGEIFGMTWDSEEAGREDKLENERVNALRRSVCAPLVKLLPKSSDEKKTAAAHVEAMYEFLRDIFMYEGLTEDVRRFEQKDTPGAVQTAQQFSQIWNKLLEILNQINVTMGDMEISFARFGEYLRAGLSQCEIRTIPSSLDAVYTGTVERSTSSPVKKLFVMGAVSGTYPEPASYDGFFTDIDRSYIRSYEEGKIDLAPTKTEQRTKQRYKVFKAIRTASEGVSVTYPSQDNDGKSVRASAFVSDIKEMFGIDKHPAFPEDAADEGNITSEYAARKGLVINSAAPLSRLSPAWRSVYRCLRDSGRHDKALEQIALASSFYSRPPRILPETADELYTRRIFRGDRDTGENGRIYSATRLDCYASCPMQYFMQYGLRLAEEVKAGIQANEVGTYVHKLVQEVCSEVYTNDEGLTDRENEERCRNAWHELDEGRLKEYIDNKIEASQAQLSESVPDYHMRKRVMRRIKNTVTRCSVNVLRSLKQGKFVLKATELSVDNVRLVPDKRVYINGAVDRVDEFRYTDGTRQENLLRIIDYKTGNTDFSTADIENGRNMQLVIYAIAAAMQYEQEDGSGTPYSLSGIYYQHMRDRYKTVAGFGAEDGSEKEIYLDGVTYLPAKDGSEADKLKRGAIIEAIDESENYIGLSEFTHGPGGKKAKTEAERDKLIERVKENIMGIDKEIMSGRILPMPYSSGKDSDACGFCRFKDICSFERNKTKRRKSSASAFGGEN
ncbi:MAG: PD-(D/E)XK nuclease family protein [bacterium]|nr:PD-(D/E)XK nuclease family protein [bacterium]